MNEFDLIRQFFSTVPTDTQVALGVGDDAAIVCPTPGHALMVSVDTLVSGQHFFADVDPTTLGHKTLAVNLSDMAAMGARPRWALLSLALPQINADWLRRFAAGLHALAAAHGVTLIGGDTTRGPLTLSVTIIGEAPQGAALCRHTAQVGDDIWVSGQLGLAALALRQSTPRGESPPPEVLALCQTQLTQPQPRVALGQALLPLAHACIDVSDGLMADLGHILTRSGCSAEVWLAALPTHPWLAARRDALVSCLAAGGDDYELCFTAPASARAAIAALAPLCPVTRVGHVVAGTGAARLLAADGTIIQLGSSGFDHFQSQT